MSSRIKSSVATSQSLSQIKGNLEDWRLNNSWDGKNVTCAMKTLQSIGGVADKKGVLTEVARYTGSKFRTCMWNPDGNEILVARYSTSSPRYQMFRFTGNSLTSLAIANASEGRDAVFWQRPDIILSDLAGFYKGTYQSGSFSIVIQETGARYACGSSNREYVGDGRNYYPYFKLWKRNGSSLSFVASSTANGAVVRAVGFSPDGKYVVTSASYVSSSYHALSLFSVGTDTLTYLDGYNSTSTSSVSFHPSGVYFISNGGGARVFKIVNNTLSVVYEALDDAGSDFYPTNPTFSPDGRYVATGNWSDTHPYIYLFRFENGELTLLGHTTKGNKNISRFSFSPDGRYIAITNYDTVSRPDALQIFEVT